MLSAIDDAPERAWCVRHAPEFAASRCGSSLRRVALIAMVLLLSACGNLRAVEEAIGSEKAFRTQLQSNVQALVRFDETYSSFALSNHSRRAGAGDAEKRYRRIVFFIVNADGGRPIRIINTYAGILAGVAMVPDGLPQLKEGDIVEMRFVGVWDSLRDFASTGEGNAVLRLLCSAEPTRAQAAAFKACASNLRWHEPWGDEWRYYQGILAALSGRRYAEHLRDHLELSFTPFYDDAGRVLPGAVPMAARPATPSGADPIDPRMREANRMPRGASQ